MALCALVYHFFRAQARFTKEELAKVSELLGLPASLAESEAVSSWFPSRGLGPMPPTDPTLYRLYEVGLMLLR